jgi:hypothetical protein
MRDSHQKGARLFPQLSLLVCSATLGAFDGQAIGSVDAVGMVVTAKR